jgi:hypothetical protein
MLKMPRSGPSERSFVPSRRFEPTGDGGELRRVAWTEAAHAVAAQASTGLWPRSIVIDERGGRTTLFGATDEDQLAVVLWAGRVGEAVRDRVRIEPVVEVRSLLRSSPVAGSDAAGLRDMAARRAELDGTDGWLHGRLVACDAILRERRSELELLADELVRCGDLDHEELNDLVRTDG